MGSGVLYDIAASRLYRYVRIYVSCSYYANEGHRRGRCIVFAAVVVADSFVSQH